MFRKTSLPLAVVLVTTASLPALAQEPPPAKIPSRDQAYVFPDDPLDAVGLSERGARLRLRGTSGRVTLIRPRAHFVFELTKSVENL